MTERQPYALVQRYRDFELRRYPAYVVAEVVVRATFTDAGNLAFRTLVGYLKGENATRATVAMTAPVLQSESRTIAMTAPVEQRETASGEQAVAFVLPSSYTLDTAPEPSRDEVTLRERRASLAAVRRYRGRWTRQAFERNLALLDHALAQAGLRAEGPATWARYNPPITPWFLRRNEVLREVAEDVAD